jgi:hypothetical protein
MLMISPSTFNHITMRIQIGLQMSTMPLSRTRTRANKQPTAIRLACTATQLHVFAKSTRRISTFIAVCFVH